MARVQLTFINTVTSHFEMGVYNQKIVFWAYLASVAIRGSLKFSVERGPMDNYLSKLESANKLVLLKLNNMQQLVATLHNHSHAKNNVLQILGLLEVSFTSMIF